MVNGKQCIIVWHVDGLKILHEDPEVVSSVLDKFERRVREGGTVDCDARNYLGMRIDYSTPGKVH
jgi:hypothetical protein